MTIDLSPPKLVLLAAHCAASGDIAGLASLTASNGDVLRKKLVLRLLLTYLPSHLKTEEYLPLLQSLESDDFTAFLPLEDVDISSVQALSDERAAKKVRKLQLQALSLPGDDTPASNRMSNGDSAEKDPDAEEPEDPLAVFLILRAYAVDDGSGALPELPALFSPFLRHSSHLRTWTISVLLPLLRRNCEYYPDFPLQQTLAEFERLPGRLAVSRLLSQTGSREESLSNVGRDLRGLVGPWLYNKARWTRQHSSGVLSPSSCPGWEEALQWLTAQASKSWRVAVSAVEQWDGPSDADLGGFGTMWFEDDELQYLEYRYARAALACIYLYPEPSDEAITGAHSILSKIVGLLDQDPIPPLQTDLSLLSPISPDADIAPLLLPRNAIHLRNDLLDESNALTSPSHAATELLHVLILSAALLNRMGSECTIRRAGELALLQSEREQKAEATKVLHWLASNGPRGEDRYWIKARNDIMWLRDWGAEDNSGAEEPSQASNGIFGLVKREYIEVELLKILLSNTRYSLARALYEDSPDLPLSREKLRETVFAVAMGAYDNASNPNRTRGGLKKCDDIIRAFPRTMEKSLPAARRCEALLAATHALGDYRLVLKQGEPFTPVVLRVHEDPLSILSKVLEQNPRSYTKVQELVSIATNMVNAGLTVGENASSTSTNSKKASRSTPTPDQIVALRTMAERRVTAMCIDAALKEDDFETAYSYVMSRLAAIAQPLEGSLSSNSSSDTTDVWSWRAALEAGKYRRTERTVRPTHLGTASANLDIRHLEQRIECLATALRIAPSDALQGILNAYRRCEEELEVAVQAEDEQENAWDEVADRSWQHQPETRKVSGRPRQSHSGMPGGFDGEGYSSDASPSGRGNAAPLASRVAAAAAAKATATYGGQASARSGPRSSRPSGSASASAPAGSSATAAGAAQTGDDAPLSLFDLSRATARAAQRNFSALSSLRHTRQLVGLGDGAGEGGKGDVAHSTSSRGSDAGDSGHRYSSDADGSGHVRKRDQLREAAMGTLTSGVGWLIGAQPVDRGQERE